MNKRKILIISVLVLIFTIGGFLYYNRFLAGNETVSDSPAVMQEKETDDIVEIPIDSVEGITKQEAEKLCYLALGEKDEDTGFTFSFGTSGAVEKGRKQYYVVRVSWLVNNSHLSYIGDFFVSANGKEIYNGLALPGEYEILDKIWSK